MGENMNVPAEFERYHMRLLGDDYGKFIKGLRLG